MTFASASSAANALDAARGPDPSITTVLLCKRNERTRDAPPLGVGYEVCIEKLVTKEVSWID